MAILRHYRTETAAALTPEVVSSMRTTVRTLTSRGALFAATGVTTTTPPRCAPRENYRRGMGAASQSHLPEGLRSPVLNSIDTSLEDGRMTETRLSQGTFGRPDQNTLWTRYIREAYRSTSDPNAAQLGIWLVPGVFGGNQVMAQGGTLVPNGPERHHRFRVCCFTYPPEAKLASGLYPYRVLVVVDTHTSHTYHYSLLFCTFAEHYFRTEVSERSRTFALNEVHFVPPFKPLVCLDTAVNHLGHMIRSFVEGLGTDDFDLGLPLRGFVAESGCEALEPAHYPHDAAAVRGQTRVLPESAHNRRTSICGAAHVPPTAWP